MGMNSKKLEAAWNSLCVKKTNNKMYRVVVKCVKEIMSLHLTQIDV